jgi:hypothetical protein
MLLKVKEVVETSQSGLAGGRKKRGFLRWRTEFGGWRFLDVDLAQTRSTSNEATPSPSTPHRSY